MIQKPRPFTTSFFNWKELGLSIVQGLVITIGTLGAYQYAIHENLTELVTRTMVFTVLITSNIFLTLVNRSFFYSIINTIQYKNNLVFLIISLTVVITGLLIYVSPFAKFFGFEALNTSQMFVSTGIGFLSVTWYEVVKWKKRKL